jgi:hypothetical protein
MELNVRSMVVLWHQTRDHAKLAHSDEIMTIDTCNSYKHGNM